MRKTFPGLLSLLFLAAGPAVARSPGTFDGVLQHVRQAAAAHKRPIVVFDLDDTLVRTAPRNYAVLKAWSETTAGAPYTAGFAKVKMDAIGWGIDPTLDTMGVPADERKALMKFWADHFFSSDYLKYDLPNPGAVAYATAVHKAGGHLIYMSGRNAATMRAGTEASMKQHGFPWDPTGKTVTLILKEQKGGDDAAYKEAASAKLPALGEVEACVDNEPGNCNAFHHSLPKATVILLEKPHSPNPPALEAGILRAKDFPI
ncbi:MAG: hypothetical protein JWM80_2469 [Cyanobacteria bacterium RYN_339]|nr:hypothetical protein [Cyanobacteria bacterium RYN_339]